MVTLEPCNHTGRTGPCAEALVEAGVARVVFAQPDPNPVAAGGEAALRDAGVEVEFGLLEREARALNRAWTFAVEHGRPFVTWKYAATLDGRSAAADGLEPLGDQRGCAPGDTHRLRGECDAILVGTGTVVRRRPAADRPRRGRRAAARRPAAARRDGGARARRRPAGCSTTRPRPSTCDTHDPREVLRSAARARPAARLPRGRADVAAAFVRARVRRRGGRLPRAHAARRAGPAPSVTSASPRSTRRSSWPSTT